MGLFGRRLKGSVSTRSGVFVSGYKTKYRVDPQLQDTVTPIATAQLNALAERNTASVAVYHNNRHPFENLPENLRYLGAGGRSRALPMLDSF